MVIVRLIIFPLLLLMSSLTKPQSQCSSLSPLEIVLKFECDYFYSIKGKTEDLIVGVPYKVLAVQYMIISSHAILS